jgi:NDP-sugar pyrophosphorylase family protein
MKAVIMVAGRGKRMGDLTLQTPKPLLKYQGKTNLDHLFEHLPKEVDEVILTVDYLADQFRSYCGDLFHGRSVSYVEGSQEGNAVGFLKTSERFELGERFVVAYGDEVFVADEMKRCLDKKYAWLCYEVKDPTNVGVVILGNNELIVKMVEKPSTPVSNIVADGFMVVDTDIFSCVSERHQDGEYYFSNMMKIFLEDHEVFAVMASPGHSQLTNPESIHQLENVIL